MSDDLIIKVLTTPNGKLIAVCDPELLGKTFEEGDRQLDLSAQFYQGEPKPKDQIEEILKDAYVVNAVGKRSTALLIELEMIEPDHILKVDNIPSAQCVVERS